MAVSEGDITRLLHEADEGRAGALDEVMELVYRQLSSMAESHLRQRYGAELAGSTLEPSALVHETFLKLVRQRNRFDNRGQFFAIATKMMIRVLNDHARRKQAEKRGGDRARVTLSGLGGSDPQHDLADFVRALERLEQSDPRTAEVTKLRLLWGLTANEVADTLGVSRATVERDWRFARSWLQSQLS